MASIWLVTKGEEKDGKEQKVEKNSGISNITLVATMLDMMIPQFHGENVDYTKMMEKRGYEYSRSFQHDTTHTCHSAKTICCVFNGQCLVLKQKNKQYCVTFVFNVL